MKSTPIPRVGTTWLCLSGLLAAGSGASAAVITWGTAQDTTVVASISNTGTPVFAKNEGTATSNVVVNGVTFVPSNSLGSTASGLLNGANTFNNDMKSLLDTVSFGATPSIDLAPLGTYILGTIYQIQVFFTDQRTTGGANDKTITFGSSGVGGNTVTLEADPNNDVPAPWGVSMQSALSFTMAPPQS